MTLYHVTDATSLKKIRAEGLTPQRGPRSTRLGEKTEAVYFFKSREFAYDAVCGWLGDAFPQGHQLFCLEVDLPEGFPLHEDPNFGEVEAISPARVPPEFLSSHYPV